MPLWVLVLALVLLILFSAFFAMAETALMASNKYRLRHMAKRGNRGAVATLWLLARTDRLLSLVLIASVLLNAMVAALATLIAIEWFGNEEGVITAAIVAVAFLLIVFAEISPKLIGATYPEPIAVATSFLLKGLMRVARPLISFVNLFVNALMRIGRIRTGDSALQQRLSPEELRSIVLEGANFIPQQHSGILLNLFDLDKLSVEDIMTPRPQIEALNLALPVDELMNELSTCYHSKLPVYEGEINRVIGILHVRKALALLRQEEDLTHEHLRALLTEPYFIPEDTGLLEQLQFFQDKRERLGIIVDEYGEVQGLVTLEDIIEELVGDFTTSMPGAAHGERFGWNAQGECLLEGATPLRDINKRLGLDLPLDGPKTVNGLLLEQLQEIPEAPIGLKIGNCVVEVVQVQDQAIRMVKLLRPAPVVHKLVA